MDAELVTVSDLVEDRTDGRIGWAVVAAFVRGPLDEPVCVDYRVRQVKASVEGAAMKNADVRSIGLRNGQRTIQTLEAHAQRDWAGSGPFSRKGIPRYLFEVASQPRLIAKARRLLKLKPTAAPEARSVFSAPERRPGRPPQRGLLEKLRILADIEAAYESGHTLADVADTHLMSRSAVRDLLSWARHDADPRLFEGITQGRKGGQMTAEARTLLEDLEAD